MDIRLEPWSEAALDLLRRINTPQMRQHVGGPEPEEKLIARHHRYLTLPTTGRGCMYAVLLGDEMVGSIAYHRRDWQGRQIFETGWNVLPPFQGRGIAAAAGAALITIAREAARQADTPDSLHAFPSVENVPSNALCRRLGFTLVGPCDFEYPPGSGSLMRSNDWRLDLVRAESGLLSVGDRADLCPTPPAGSPVRWTARQNPRRGPMADHSPGSEQKPTEAPERPRAGPGLAEVPTADGRPGGSYRPDSQVGLPLPPGVHHRCPECRGTARLPGMVKTTGMGRGAGSAYGPCPTCDGVGYLVDDDLAD
ncbi:GNAT family N-acetyltransferase [Plantactinospora sp. B24E8]